MLGVSAVLSDASLLCSPIETSTPANLLSLEHKETIDDSPPPYAIDLEDAPPPLYAAIRIMDNTTQPPSADRNLDAASQTTTHGQPPPQKNDFGTKPLDLGLHIEPMSQIEDDLDEIFDAYFAEPDDDAQPYKTNHDIEKPPEIIQL